MKLAESSPARPVFLTLDGIRGVAALLVVVRHVPYFGSLSFQESYLAVDLFFLLSGVVIASAYEHRLARGLGVGRFILMRFLRIWPLYFLGCLVGAAALLSGGTSAAALLPLLLCALWMIPAFFQDKPYPLNSPAWSLFSELIANIVYGLLHRQLSNTRLAAIVALSGAGLGWIVWRHGSLDVGYLSSTLALGLVRVGYSFFAGVLLFRWRSRVERPLPTVLLHAATPWLVLGAVFIVLSQAPYGFKRALYDVLAVTLVFPLLIWVALAYSPERRSATVFKVLGVISFPLYALHSPLSKFIPVLGAASGLFEPSRNAVTVGALFLAVLAPLCWPLERHVDLPLRRALMRRMGGPGSRETSST